MADFGDIFDRHGPNDRATVTPSTNSGTGVPALGTIGSVIGAIAGGMFGPAGVGVGSMAGRKLGEGANWMMQGGAGASPAAQRPAPQQTPIDQLLQTLGGKAGGKVGDLLRKPDNEWPKGDYETTPVTAPDVTRSPEVWS